MRAMAIGVWLEWVQDFRVTCTDSILCASSLRTMKLLKPDWVSHEGSPIFSVAIHPDGSRFATGGQGKDSGVVVIWNMAPVRNAADEANADIPKVLCEMSNHLGCVNCVRWSVDGKWLASGGDDALVMIWAVKYQGEGATNLGFGTELERWGCIHMLRGHGGDVLDLSWSPDQRYLASCSVDNSIVIWNARELPQILATVTGHTGLVKGVTWDPVGKYLASQSDDKSVRIWRTSDWNEEKVITEPFRRCGGTTHILRLSWSPDGRYIVSAHALNNDGPTAQIIERGDWKMGVDLVGHRKAVEVASFNPHLFFSSKDSQDANHGCIAVGSRDRSLSIWLTSLKRPLVVTHDLFVDSILDLAWSQDGYELMVCSTDGSLGYFSFSQEELGVRLPKQALDNLFKEVYGCSRAGSRPAFNSSLSNILIEDPAMLQHHEVKSPADRKMSTSQEKLIAPPAVQTNLETKFDSAKVPTITTQTETRTKDGKRRITPVMLTSQVTSHNTAPRPFTSTPSKNSDKSSIEKPAQSNPGLTSETLTSGKSGMDTQLLSPPAKPISFEPLSPKISKSKPPDSSFSPSSKGQKRRLEIENEPLPRTKRQKKLKSSESSPQPPPPKLGTPQKGSSVSNVVQKRPLLTIPASQSTITVQLVCGLGGSEPLTLEVDNTRLASCSLSCKRGDKVLWTSSLLSRGLVATGNHCIVCVVGDDNTMSVFSSPSGRLLLARFAISSPPHDVKVSSYSAMLVTADAHVSVWDMQRMEIVVKEASFAHLLCDNRTLLRRCSLTNTGTPILTLTDSSFLYHRDMGVWVEVCNSTELAEVRGIGTDFNSGMTEVTSLQQLQTATLSGCETTSQALSRLRDGSAKLMTVSFLESQISRSISLKSPFEYQHWTKTYVKYLVKEGLEGRLREFCMQFCGPGVGLSVVLGFQRQAMLKDFLTLIASNATLQRLYCELRDAVDTCV